MIIRKFEGTDFRLVVHDKGFELFILRKNPRWCGDFDWENPFEHWENISPDEMDDILEKRSQDSGYRGD